MAEIGLSAEVRDGRGKGVARKLRAQGKVPATMYGRGAEPMSLAVDARELSHSLSTDAGMNVLIDLQVNGESHLTLARQLDRNPLRGDIIHVDFLKIAHDQKIHVEVRLHVEGESPGTKEGGVLEHHLWELDVECFPTDVPDSITIDISGVNVGDSLRVGDVTAPDGVTILNEPDEVLLTCAVPTLKMEAELEEVPLEGEEVAVAAEAEGEEVAEGEAPAPEGGEEKPSGDEG